MTDTPRRRSRSLLDDPEARKVTGEALKRLRERKGVTQAGLASQLGFATSAPISKMENGTRPLRVEELERILEVLGCSYDEYRTARGFVTYEYHGEIKDQDVLERLRSSDRKPPQGG